MNMKQNHIKCSNYNTLIQLIQPAMKAIAVFQGKLKGSHVSFKQDDPFSPVKVSGHIENLAPGKHGFHVHQFGNLLSSDCANCGGHFNPTNAEHGSR